MHPPCFGGLSRYADKICQLHAARGHTVEAWTTLEDDRPRVEWRQGYVVRRYPALFWMFENPLTLSGLPQLLRNTGVNFDLLVVHSHLMFTSSFGLIKSKLSHCPLVLISHGYEVHRGPFFGMIQSGYISTVGRAIALNSSRIVTMTNREARRFINLGVSPEKCAVIPSGVDSEFFRTGEGTYDMKMILWTGRFVPEKNLACLLRAFALLKNRRHDVRLMLVGEGPERSKLMALSRELHLNDEVVFPGVLSQERISNLLQKATVFALPSTAEALPVSMLEAISTGVPVVVSRGLGLEEVLDGAGLAADPTIPEEWAQKIELLLNDQDLRTTIARRGRGLAATRYDWRYVADRLEKLFTSVVEDPNISNGGSRGLS